MWSLINELWRTLTTILYKTTTNYNGTFWVFKNLAVYWRDFLRKLFRLSISTLSEISQLGTALFFFFLTYCSSFRINFYAISIEDTMLCVSRKLLRIYDIYTNNTSYYIHENIYIRVCSIIYIYIYIKFQHYGTVFFFLQINVYSVSASKYKQIFPPPLAGTAETYAP